MKRRNRLLTIIFILLLSVGMLSACKSRDNSETDTLGKAQKEEQVALAPTKEVTEVEPTTVPAVETVILKEIRDINAVELVGDIKIGWNLGNTLDATGGGSSISSETSWGNPITTADMIKTVKEAGFNVIRIPTTWENHLGSAPDYIINEDWFYRVQTIVDYAINNDMYVILNMHHEEWHFPSYDNLDTAKVILTKAWAQIAGRFQAYDEHLIFEGMNEPRMKGTNLEWNGGNEEARDVINQLNAAFIETIRNAEGNNPLRHLMIPCYAASADPKVWKDFVVPEDDKIIVSIHAYTPYNFTLNKAGTSEWSTANANDTREVDNLMKNIYNNFISKGQPVIIGEFGAMSKDNLEARAAWTEYYIKKAAEVGIPCVWWDNGAFSGSGELFGLLKRKTLAWEHLAIVEALMKGLD
ncbi:MAG TPA: glycoside hydrolase family 5 protein [Mobilitalea sp.]|nr:glycoside hydrolase family 5 protein [Mobilitalea sp.]